MSPGVGASTDQKMLGVGEQHRAEGYKEPQVSPGDSSTQGPLEREQPGPQHVQVRTVAPASSCSVQGGGEQEPQPDRPAEEQSASQTEPVRREEEMRHASPAAALGPSPGLAFKGAESHLNQVLGFSLRKLLC